MMGHKEKDLESPGAADCAKANIWEPMEGRGWLVQFVMEVPLVPACADRGLKLSQVMTFCPS